MHPNAQPLAEAQRQLHLMLEQQEQLAPGLYRDLALYLQVLREGLLPAVQQACFHLATQVVPERYGQLPEARRRQFQHRLATLVQRCSALLTVEQLMGLAAQQQRRSHRRQLAERQHMLEAFLEGGAAPTAAAEAEGGASGSGVPDPHPGSVSLGLDLPLSADLLDSGIPGLAGTRSATASPSEPAGPELKLLQSLFQLAAEGLGGDNPAGSAELVNQEAEAVRDPELPPRRAGSAAEESSLLALAARVEEPSPPDPSLTGSSLPRDPWQQLQWWRHCDEALSRRLRNLSHALNVEMMRLGLAQGLLPLNLLDAVLAGQVEALPAPANLLRLPLPLPQLAGAPGEVLALLLRSSDLEYEQPRLRTCRKRLEQRRRALRTMAKRYRIWQRRVTALEAEQQWYRDSAQPQSPTQPPR